MLLFAIAAALAAQAPPAVNTQQAFEAAAAAADRRDWATALAQLDALEAKLAAGKSPRSLAIVRVRKGEALFNLGRMREAEASVRAGLAGLPADDASLREDRVFANIILGGIAERGFDFPTAYRAYEDALTHAKGTSLETQARTGSVRAGMFVAPRAAATSADGAMNAITATEKAARDQRAQWRTLKGRALLNAGDFAAASAELERATQELGGLTTRVTYSDLVARSDMAIAALLAGKPDKAREHLAYTGAGRFETGYMPGPSHYPLPACGAETGLRAEDVAVVEVAVRENGRVGAATPIYGSRIGVAAKLARSLEDWTWPVEDVAKLTPFLRQFTRLEVRCRQTPDRNSVVEMMRREHDAWTRGAGADVTTLRGLPLSALRTRFASNANDASARLAVARAIEEHPMTDRSLARETAAQAATIADARNAPAGVLAYWQTSRAALDSFESTVPLKQRAGRYLDALTAIAGSPALRGDARTQAILEILRAETAPSDEKNAEQRMEAAFRRVSDWPGLAAGDDVKVGAAVRLASLLSRKGRHEEALRVYAGAGLPAGRCPALDTGRAVRRTGADDADFPMTALDWGFSGWANVESVIGTDRASVVRTLFAYPPFVFGDAAQGIARSARYEPSVRPEAEAICGGQSLTIRFAMAED